MRLVIADDHEGLRAAAARVFHASHQRCRVHRMRSALARVPPKQGPAVVAMLKTIFAQEGAEAARDQWHTSGTRSPMRCASGCSGGAPGC